MKLKIALLQILPGKNLAEQTMIGKKACEQASVEVAIYRSFMEIYSPGKFPDGVWKRHLASLGGRTPRP